MKRTYVVRTADYSNEVSAIDADEAIQIAFKEKPPSHCGFLTEVRLVGGGADDIWYIQSATALENVGYTFCE